MRAGWLAVWWICIGFGVKGREKNLPFSNFHRHLLKPRSLLRDRASSFWANGCALGVGFRQGVRLTPSPSPFGERGGRRRWGD